MPKQIKGGTEMFCPYCKRITVCKGLPISEIELVDPTPRQELGGVKYFKRYRKCLGCKVHFETAEVPESLIFELIGLRELVNDLKERIDIGNDPIRKLELKNR